MKDLELTFGRQRSKEEDELQVKMIYEDLVNDVIETFGDKYNEPQNPQIETKDKMEIEVNQDKQCEEDHRVEESDISESQKNTQPATTEKVIWKPKSQEEKKDKTKRSFTKKKEEDVQAILKNQMDILTRLEKIEKKEASKRKIHQMSDDDDIEQAKEASPMEPVKALLGATKKFVRYNITVTNNQDKDRRQVTEAKHTKEKKEKRRPKKTGEKEESKERRRSEKTGEKEDSDLQLKISDKEAKEILYDDISEDEDNQKVTRKMEQEGSERKKARVDTDLRRILDERYDKTRVCTGECQNKRPHQWCHSCKRENSETLSLTYQKNWDYGGRIPTDKKEESEALEWAVKKGKRQNMLKHLLQDTPKEAYRRKRDRHLAPSHQTKAKSEGPETDQIFSEYNDPRDPVGKRFMSKYYSTVSPIFTKIKSNSIRCCNDDDPVGTIRQHVHHTLEDHSHLRKSQVQCLACLSMGNESTFCSPARLARHISNVHEKVLMCAHQRAHMSYRSDIWLQSYSQMLSAFVIEKLHANGHLKDEYYLDKPQKPRSKTQQP